MLWSLVLASVLVGIFFLFFLAPCVQRYYVCAFAVMHVHRSRVPSRVPEGLSVSSGGSKRGSMAESLKATVDHNPSYNGRVAASNGNTLDAQAPGLSADDRNPHGETGYGETGDGLRSTSRTMTRGAGTSTGLEQLHRDSVVAGLCAEDRLHPVLATSLGLSRYCEFTQSQMLQLLANRTVVLLGDSITGRTFAHFVCLVETGAPCDTPCVETRVPSERQGSYSCDPWPSLIKSPAARGQISRPELIDRVTATEKRAGMGCQNTASRSSFTSFKGPGLTGQSKPLVF